MLIPFECEPGDAVILTLPDGRLVRVSVAKVYESRVQLGVEAPRDVPIARGELLVRGEGK